MAHQGEHHFLSLLVLHERIRRDLLDLLRKNGHDPMVMSGLDESISLLKNKSNGILFLDREAVRVYGIGIYSKLRVASPLCRIVLLCDQAHRDLIKEAMECGAYGSILEPYAEWEVLTIVRHILSDTHSRKATAKPEGQSTRSRMEGRKNVTGRTPHKKANKKKPPRAEPW